MTRTKLAVLASALLLVSPALAQQLPKSPSEVANPGGKISGAQKLAMVKVADGFNDPVGVSVANDGSGRIFVVERVGRVKVVGKDGKALPKPFLDLTKTNPLGSEVQTGFVEQGLWSIAFHPKFKENGHVYVHFASLPFNGASIIARYTVDTRKPQRDHHRAGEQDRQGDHEHPAALLQSLRRHDCLWARRQALHRQGRCGLGGRSARRRPAARRALGQDASDRRRHAGRRRRTRCRRTIPSPRRTSRR